MAKVNLEYATNGLGFFTKIKKINSIICESKKKDSISIFDAKDEKEIGRDRSYAVFPELRIENAKITLESFRRCLNNRGIQDLAFQNKILNMILQNRDGVQFAMNKIVDSLLYLEDEYPIWMRPDLPEYKIELEVDNNNSVNLIFKGIWETLTTDDSAGPKENAIEACIKINISRDLVAITSFDLTKLSDMPNVTKAFELLEANQQNILMKLITFIRHVLGYNSELRLEERQENDRSWSPGN
ncbi:Uncharacterised protein [Legionella steigerwaltii]|uniref:Uncharacterized protein n=1 Tax=Legionella steigerwaltii TaxID=460 RepID=A0A378LAT1_9GAMM|nr:hypothetical protein [Legionella steigerwaltii]KTD77712.1 hypothetical protein Lstg_2069 [Legionella steigerwaltii]STY23022.1 Uncharacterised protein [Legionella steigerwaltii]